MKDPDQEILTPGAHGRCVVVQVVAATVVVIALEKGIKKKEKGKEPRTITRIAIIPVTTLAPSLIKRPL